MPASLDGPSGPGIPSISLVPTSSMLPGSPGTPKRSVDVCVSVHGVLMVYCMTCRKLFILLTKVLSMELTCTCNLLVVDCKRMLSIASTLQFLTSRLWRKNMHAHECVYII